MTIGRDATCDIQLPDDNSISRYHAVVEFDGEQCRVYDSDSANGTFINEQQVGTEGHPFAIGDALRVGSSMFILKATSAIEDQTTVSINLLEKADTVIAVPKITPAKVEPPPEKISQKSAISKFSIGGLVVVLLFAVFTCLAGGGILLWWQFGDSTTDKPATNVAVNNTATAAGNSVDNESSPTSSPTNTVLTPTATVNKKASTPTVDENTPTPNFDIDPTFNLPDSKGNNFNLTEMLEQKNVVIVFYIGHY
jgi:pSer/pThr/pTyr-binding forkhead associated (FHA) protein